MSATAIWAIALVATAFLSSVLGGIVVILFNAWVNKADVRVVERKVIVRPDDESVMLTAEDEAAFWSGRN